MYVLGLDFGTKKLGAAILEEDSGICSPLPLVKNDIDLWKNLEKILSDYRIQKVVLGLPSYENTAKKVTHFANELKTRYNVAIEYTGEDNTSIAVKKGLTSLKQKQNLDSMSAVEILQQWRGMNKELN